MEAKHVLLRDLAYREFDRLQLMKEAAWTAQRERLTSLCTPAKTKVTIASARCIDTSSYFSISDICGHPMLLTSHIVILCMNLLYRLPRKPTLLLVSGLRMLLRQSGVKSGLAGTSLGDKLPKDARTILKQYDLDPRTRSYVSCPECFALYSERPLPPVCSYQDIADGPVCGASLWRKRSICGNTVYSPIRTYLYQDIAEWLGRLLSRPDLEKNMDIAHHGNPASRNNMCDIWDAGALRKISYRGSPFIIPPSRPPQSISGPEGRYVFSLAIDGFNPFTNKEAKQNVSSTAIYMVCLNLPPHKRFLPENLYLVGIVPGPKKPSLHHINHVIEPLVTDLLELWHRGILYSRTALYPEGRLVRCALGPVVCDLPAARQLVGLGGIGFKKFCSCCWQTLDDLADFSTDNWQARDQQSHRARAEEWKNAKDLKTRNLHFKEHGVRWSQLLRLPYWDPIEFTIIDTMHNHYLGLFATHCREIWGMSIKVEDGDGIIPADRHFPMPAKEKMAHGWRIFCQGTESQLRQCTVPVLWNIAQILGVPVKNQKKKFMSMDLITWRSRQEPDYLQEILDNYGDGEGPKQDAPDTTPQSADPLLALLTLKAEKALHRPGMDPQKLKTHRKDVLQALCTARRLDHTGVKETLATRLLDWLHGPGATGTTANDSESTNNESFDDSGSEPIKRGFVLGKSTLTAVQADMTRTVVPSWIDPAPSNLGTPSRGKLSADQWRSACTINLPLTLIRLWGDSVGRQKDVLDNFMDLVAAVELAGLLVISNDHATLYLETILRYLRTLGQLYPHTRFKPNHHMAIHVADMMKRFGPLRSIRAFSTERNNHMLQMENINMKFGDIEKTYMTHTCRAANLRAVIRSEAIRAAAAEFIEDLEGDLNEDGRGTRVREFVFSSTQLTCKPIGLPEKHALDKSIHRELSVFLNQPQGTLPDYRMIPDQVMKYQDGIQIFGVTYRAYRERPKDSNVYFISSKGSVMAGRISLIFEHTRLEPPGHTVTEFFLAIETLQDLTVEDQDLDPYRKYTLLGGRMYYNEYSVLPHVVRPSAIKTHFAMMELDRGETAVAKPCVVALSLDRVVQHATSVPISPRREEI